MSKLTQIVRSYSLRVNNGRTNHTIVDSLDEEAVELREEVDKLVTGEDPGPDGIVGESIDVIACALDMIFYNHPNITDEALDSLMEAKCAKWLRKYG